MLQGRKFSGFLVVIMVALVLPVISLSAENRLQLVAKPPKLNGGAATTQAAETQPAATPAPAAKASSTPGAAVSRPAASDANQPSTPVSAPEAVAAGADPTLVALGALGASNLYFTYLTLGTVADGYVSGTYEPQVAISVANESIFMNTTAMTNLSKMLDSATLAKEDKDVVAYMVKTYDVLISQAKSLVQFISNQKDDGSSYQKYRTEAWKRIVDLFGIK